ncbi:enkurin domain-containing protein 1 isoform X3 [Ailuropoda melanoleuca]|uniref:enkurin domain-containing protein 1 isoform X3 n=1 Tax=Ailuropoda melanoleuca TaxID=9646 RepID=UPI001494AB7C|nr:enkurin domain-containing protein 1 isoform X3 [Ailuropoda melanoleuca]
MARGRTCGPGADPRHTLARAGGWEGNQMVALLHPQLELQAPEGFAPGGLGPPDLRDGNYCCLATASPWGCSSRRQNCSGELLAQVFRGRGREPGREGSDGGMCEGPSRISGPIPPDPTLCPDYYRRPASAQGRLEGNELKLDLLTSDLDLDATPPRGPRIGPGAREILERGRRGVGGVLLQLGGISLGPGACPKRKDPKDHEKENLKRIREIQRRFREQKHSREQGEPRPLKALWRSPKYDKVESRVKAQLQEPSPASGTEPVHFLRAHSRCGPGLPPPRVPSPQLTPPGPSAKGPGLGVDFISHNVRTAKRAPRRHSRSLQVLAQVLEQQRQAQEHYNATQKGHVPPCWNAGICGGRRLRPASRASRTLPCPLATLACLRTSGWRH